FGPGLRSDFKSTILKTGLYMKLNVKIQSLAKIFIDILGRRGIGDNGCVYVECRNSMNYPYKSTHKAKFLNFVFIFSS
ncbi:MAG: hypothetical protein RBR97_10905, partial [Bacteroidales bacterium]|nr:hypothetical protein [Bacteroidales bacterium]